MLALFGIGAFIGLGVGGRIADRFPFRTLFGGLVGILAVSAAIALTAGSAVATIVMVFGLGFAAFVLNPAVYARVFAVGSEAPNLAGATAVSAFQLGITIAALLGGAAIDATGDLRSITWVGMVASVVAGLAVAADAASARRVDTFRLDAGDAVEHQPRDLPR